MSLKESGLDYCYYYWTLCWYCPLTVTNSFIIKIIKIYPKYYLMKYCLLKYLLDVKEICLCNTVELKPFSNFLLYSGREGAWQGPCTNLYLNISYKDTCKKCCLPQ